MTTFSATPQTASVLDPTNEPTSALRATYGVARATTPPPSAALARDAPSGLLIPRAAPDSVMGPRVQSTPSSPSALFASLLYAGVTATAKPSLPSGPPSSRHRANSSLSFDELPLDGMLLLVPNVRPKSTSWPTPAASVNVG